jgi:hypothetical protein
MAIATTLSQPGISIEGIVGGTIEPEKFALFADASGTANFINTVNTASLQIVGDIEVHFDVAYAIWNGGESFIMTKGPTFGTPRDYYFRVGVFGGDFLDTHIVPSPGTGNGNSNDSNVATGFADNSRHHLRYVWDDSASEATWYTGDDGINWIQLGAAEPLSSIGQNTSTGDLNIGSTLAGNGVIVGRMYRAKLYSGLTDESGTLVADMNPSEYESGNSWNSKAFPSQTWTLNGAVTIEEE